MQPVYKLTAFRPTLVHDARWRETVRNLGLRRLSAGEYVLMNVRGAIANFRPANWTVVSDINPHKTLSVKLTGKAIVLEVRSPGMLLLVR